MARGERTQPPSEWARRISKPHYAFRPGQLLRRMRARELAATPWNEMRVPEDVIGRGIARTGVHELAVSETVWRLTGPEDLAVDVGANVGYFTGLLARRAREVIALEPNPLLLPILRENIARWQGEVRLLPVAASDTRGHAHLHLLAGYEHNNGIASLVEQGTGEGSYEVETTRLEDVIQGRPVGILKIDVEGHELSVLAGTPLDLVREIVFEHHGPLAGPVIDALRAADYEIRGIEESFLGPHLVDRVPRSWDAPTYLATRRLDEVRRLIAPRGWRCLRG